MKAISKIKALPYTSFPAISSNDIIGGVVFACDSDNHYTNTYFVFKPNGAVQITDLGSFIIWYHPSPVNYTELNMRTDSTSDITGDIQGSNNGINWVTISSYSININNATIQLDYSDYYKYYKMTLSASNNAIGFINPVGTYLWYIATLNPDGSQVGNSLDTTKNVERKYFKYNYTTFVQPVLNNNNLLGGYHFAIYPSSIRSASYDAFHAFDQSSNTLWIPASGAADTTPEYVIMYNPKPLNVTSIQIHNGSPNNTAFVSGDVQYSDDNSNWTTITTWTNSTQTANAVWDIDLSSNTGYHKYYKLYISEWKHSGNYPKRVNEITLIGTEQTVISGTTSDYDYYLDLDTYKAVA